MTILADDEHFYKVSGKLLGKILQILEYFPENEPLWFFRLGELSEMITHESFEEVENNG
jgi:hypothetical protein